MHNVHQPYRVDLGVDPELNDGEPTLAVDTLNAELIGNHADAAVLGQAENRRRERTVPIPDLFERDIKIPLGPRGIYPSVEDAPLGAVEHVARVDIDAHAQ